MIKLLYLSVFAVFCTSPTSSFAQTALPKAGITLDRIMKSGAKQFDKLDLNHDGIVDEAEWSAHVEEMVAKLRNSQAKRWEDMDTSKLKKVSKQDFLASRAKWFAEVDSEGAGTIDGEKIRRYNYSRSKVQPN